MISLKSECDRTRSALFTQRRRSGSPLEAVHAMARGVDRLLRDLVAAAMPDQVADATYCLVALGGYGRGELSPYSDIDLLLLHREGTDAQLFASLVRAIWDTGLNLGCATRTPSECGRILGDDLATDTALLEASYVAGDSDLFHSLMARFVRPWFNRHKRSFINELCAALREGVYSEQNTLYRVEPNVKSGICGMRDCQRIRWIQRAWSGAIGGQAGCEPVFLGKAASEQLRKDYAFLHSVRNELHMQAARRLDILEVGMQKAVAVALGHASETQLMEQYFRGAQRIRECAITILETAHRGSGFWQRLRSSAGAFNVVAQVDLVDGILQLSSNASFRQGGDAQWILSVFRAAIVCQGTFSTGLRNYIRSSVQQLSPQAFKTTAIYASFCELLDLNRGVGRILQQMYDTLFLQALIPEFSGLTCMVEYDSYHEYTVDQHTLLAVAAVDMLSRDDDDLVRSVYLSISSRRQLRLALLLHDIGKALPGEHTVRGAIIAEQICARLGLDDPQQEQIRFLVYNHLVLSQLSLRREPDEHLIRDLAAQIGTLENLDLLFLLTVLDIRHVGSHAWTGWKAVQVKQVYLSVREQLIDRSENPGGEAPSWRLSRVDYRRDVFPEEQRRHQDWLRESAPGELRIYSEELIGFDRITVVGTDRPRFLADLIGCLSSEGMRIVSAHVYSLPQARALDVFHVEHDKATTVTLERKVESVRKKWDQIMSDKASAAALVAERAQRYPVKGQRRGGGSVTVLFDTVSAADHTILEIGAPDGFDLLRRIAVTLSDSGLEIVSAKIETRIDRAVDVFYIRMAQGGKVVDPEVLSAVRERLMSALDS